MNPMPYTIVLKSRAIGASTMINLSSPYYISRNKSLPCVDVGDFHQLSNMMSKEIPTEYKSIISYVRIKSKNLPNFKLMLLESNLNGRHFVIQDSIDLDFYRWIPIEEVIPMLSIEEQKNMLFFLNEIRI